MTGREREREKRLCPVRQSPSKSFAFAKKSLCFKTLDLFEFGSTHSQKKKEACPTLNFNFAKLAFCFVCVCASVGGCWEREKGNLTLVVPLIFEAASNVPKLCFGYRRSGSSCSSPPPPPTATHNISCSSQQRQCSKLSSASQTKTTNYNY